MRLPHLLKIGAVLAATLLVGCSVLGYRQDLPIPTGTCKSDLAALETQSTELKAAYAWRAAYNRNAIYVGGILLLGTVAATGGLGAAAAAGLSIALLAVSGTFVSGSIALFHNADLANAYTTAEQSVNTALGAVIPSDCENSYPKLLKAVTDAINQLERDRTTIAQSAAATDIKNLQATVAVLAATPTVAQTAPTAPRAGGPH